MIIDALAHVTPDATWFGTGKDAGEARLLREMDEAGVQRAVVVGIADVIPNEFVRDLAVRNGHRVIPGGSFNPARFATPAEAVAAVRIALLPFHFPVFKLHPRLGGFDPLDPRVLAVLEEVSAWNPRPMIWLCTLIFGQVPLRKGIVETMHEIVVRFPSLRFLLLHGGGPEILKLAEAVRGAHNAMIDISFTFYHYANTSVARDLGYLLDNFNRRTVYGSDFPEIGLPEAVSRASALLDGVAPEVRERVMCGNLARFLNDGI